MADTAVALDTCVCPLCGGPNGCAMAARRNNLANDAGARGSTPEATACWCFSAIVSRDAMDAMPSLLRDRVCICTRCAEGIPAVQKP